MGGNDRSFPNSRTLLLIICLFLVVLTILHFSAQEATANAYLPILAGINVLHILLLVSLNQSWTTWNTIGVLATWAFQIFAFLYVGEYQEYQL